MSFFFKALLVGQPQNTDTIAVYKAGTTTLLTGLLTLSGGALNNPFIVSAAGGEGHWGFIATTENAYDVYWEEGNDYLAKSQHDPNDPTVLIKTANYIMLWTTRRLLLPQDLTAFVVAMFISWTTLPGMLSQKQRCLAILVIQIHTVHRCGRGYQLVMDGFSLVLLYSHQMQHFQT
jgi:hypothetical protein